VGNRTTHRTYCRICIATCGLEIDVEDGRVAEVRGDPDHPLSAGYTCSKGRALGDLHHGPHRLDGPMVRRDGVLTPVAWDEAMSDVRSRLSDLVAGSGPGAVGIFTGGGIYFDAAGYWAKGRLTRRLGSGHVYSDTTIDSAAKYRVMELMAGTYALMAHPDPGASLLVMLGTNPVVSHGQTPMFENPVTRLRRSAGDGEVWVVDPRTTESARLANRHLAIRPGTDHVLLAWLVRSILEAGVDRDELARRADHVDGLAAAVAPYPLDVTARLTGVAEQDLLDLLAAVRRAGRLAVLTGTGVTMSPAGNAVEWLTWALLVLTDSIDRPGGMWCNPGYLAKLDERESMPAAGPPRPGPATRPDIPALMGEWPAAVIPAEIEAGNLRALVVLGGSIVTALPDTARVLAALRRLDLLVVVDVAESTTTAEATHVLPAHAQLERSDLPMLNDLFSSRRMMQYTRAVLPRSEGRRSAWWILAKIGEALGVEVLPAGLDADQASDDDILDLVGGADALASLRAAGQPWLEGPSPVTGWLHQRLPSGRWNLAPDALVAQMATLEAPAPLVLTPRRQPKRFNGRTIRAGDRAEVLLHPQDAAGAGVADGDLVEVSSEAGVLVLRARVTDSTRPGAASIAHGWPDCNVNTLVSSRVLDPLTGMPRMSGTAVSVRPAGAPPQHPKEIHDVS
jgi:anaerobic selenocysteine-containing dehydrogenase